MRYAIPCVALSACLAMTSIIAKTAEQATLKLYAKPDSQSKVVASLPSDQAIIPIFNQKGWSKIADPKTGAVGWVSDKTLAAHNMPRITVRSFGQKNKHGQAQGYQIIQYSSENSNAPNKAMVMQAKQASQQMQQLRAGVQQAIQQNMQQFNRMMQQFPTLNGYPTTPWMQPLPILQPIIILPENAEHKATSWWQKIKQKFNGSADKKAGDDKTQIN